MFGRESPENIRLIEVVLHAYGKRGWGKTLVLCVVTVNCQGILKRCYC